MTGEGIGLPVRIGGVSLWNCDCMDLMRGADDGEFALAIVYPPYGMAGRWISKKGQKNHGCMTLGADEIARINEWDVAPCEDYFRELMRVSRNQIIWGGNYFLRHLGDCRGPIIWNKGQRGFTLADGEMAWSSFDRPLRICDCGHSIRAADKASVGGRWHPTQKPKYLYSWLLENYARKGDRVLDTHLGSGTIAMACIDMGFELAACEIDRDYFERAAAALREYDGSRGSLFD